MYVPIIPIASCTGVALLADLIPFIKIVHHKQYKCPNRPKKIFLEPEVRIAELGSKLNVVCDSRSRHVESIAACQSD